MEAELKFIRTSRKYYRAKVTRLHNFVIAHQDNLTLEAKQGYKDDLLNTKHKLDMYNDDFGKALAKTEQSEDDIEKELEGVDEYEDRIASTLRMVEPPVVVPNAQAEAAGDIPAERVHVSNAMLKLPILSLPEFSNASNESYDKFILSFETIINNYNIGQIEKYLYLKKQLHEEPLLFNSLSAEEQSYDSAKALLDKAFSSPLNQKFELISKMINLRLPYPGEPYKFVSEFRTIKDEIKRLSLDVETIFQYFVLNALNEKFNSTLMNFTRETKPSIDVIDETMFQVVERYMFDMKHDTSSPIIGMATNINYPSDNVKPKVNNFKFKSCILCPVKRESESSYL